MLSQTSLLVDGVDYHSIILTDGLSRNPKRGAAATKRASGSNRRLWRGAPHERKFEEQRCSTLNKSNVIRGEFQLVCETPEDLVLLISN